MSIDRLSPIGGTSPTNGLGPVAAPTAKTGAFGDSLRAALGAVESTTADANQAVGNMLTGTGDVHEAVIALHRAETTLQLTVQIRNKIVQAYQDIMRMPV